MELIFFLALSLLCSWFVKHLFYTIFNWWLNFNGNYHVHAPTRFKRLCACALCMCVCVCVCKTFIRVATVGCVYIEIKSRSVFIKSPRAVSMSQLRRFWLKIYQFILAFAGASHQLVWARTTHKNELYIEYERYHCSCRTIVVVVALVGVLFFSLFRLVQISLEIILSECEQHKRAA